MRTYLNVVIRLGEDMRVDGCWANERGCAMSDWGEDLPGEFRSDEEVKKWKMKLMNVRLCE